MHGGERIRKGMAGGKEDVREGVKRGHMDCTVRGRGENVSMKELKRCS